MTVARRVLVAIEMSTPPLCPNCGAPLGLACPVLALSVMKPLPLIIGLVIAGGGAAAYFATRGKLDTGDADAKLKAIAEQTVAPVKNVECPAAKRKKGTTFNCTVDFIAGRTVTLIVSITDDDGHFDVRWDKPIASAEKLDALIASSIKEHGGKNVTVDCGKGIVDVPPEGRKCNVMSDGELLHATVNEDPATTQVTWSIAP